MSTFAIDRPNPRDARVPGRRSWLRNPAMRDLLPVLVLGLVAEMLVNPLGNFPANDDWVYALTVREILRTGIYAAPTPSLPNLVLQSYWGALFCLPFGFSFVALRASTLVLGAVGLIGAYGFCREAGGSRRMATIAALTLALNPLYFELSNTFMTDVPYLALNAVAFWSFARGLREGRDRWIGVGIGVALAAIFVRQFAIILVFAFGLVRSARSGWSRRSLFDLAWTSALGIAGHFLFHYWMLESGRTPPKTLIVAPALTFSLLPEAVINSLASLQYLGLMVSPLYLATGFSGPRAILLRRSPFFSALLAAVLGGELGLVAWTNLSLPQLGNVLLPFGVGPLTLRDAWLLRVNLPVTPLPLLLVWRVARVLGVFAAAAIAIDLAELVRRSFLGMASRLEGARLDAAIALVTLAYGAAWLLMASFHNAYDRYLLMMVLPIAAMIAREADKEGIRGARLAPAIVVLAGFAVFSVAAVRDYFAFQIARNAATDGLEAAGISAREIDGGYEYNGMRLSRPDYRQMPPKSYWWVDDDRYIVALGPLPGYAIWRRYTFSRWLTDAPSEVVVLRRLADPGR